MQYYRLLFLIVTFGNLHKFIIVTFNKMHNSQACGLPCCTFCPFNNNPDLMHAVGEEGTIGSSQSPMRTTRYAYSETKAIKLAINN